LMRRGWTEARFLPGSLRSTLGRPCPDGVEVWQDGTERTALDRFDRAAARLRSPRPLTATNPAARKLHPFRSAGRWRPGADPPGDPVGLPPTGRHRRVGARPAGLSSGTPEPTPTEAPESPNRLREKKTWAADQPHRTRRARTAASRRAAWTWRLTVAFCHAGGFGVRWAIPPGLERDGQPGDLWPAASERLHATNNFPEFTGWYLARAAVRKAAVRPRDQQPDPV
jgi:hypothetical protein